VNRTVAVIQARTGSNRLPGKILELLDGESSLLAYQCRRLRQIAGVDELVIATTESADDDVIVEIGEAEGIRVFRGSENDVLSRFLLVADRTLATTLVRITSDSPFRDPGVIATCVAEHHQHGSEYTRPAPGHLPKGMRAEVVETAVLRQLNSAPDTTVRDREHVTVHIREHEDAFRTHRVEFPSELNHPDFDLSVDTPADLEFVRSIHAALVERAWPADIQHICKMLDEVPVDQTPLRGFA
jgi:spore coat polysaccharide biosynthesis protein SpsF